MRWLVLVIVAVAGCRLGPKVKPLPVRYFSPEVTATSKAPQPAAQARLRLGRISPSTHLRYRIVHRQSPVEVAQYETLRWTEPPDVYLRRALVRELFETHPLEQAVGGGAPTLDVELIAFEQVRRGAGHAGRVQLWYQLHDDERVLARGDLVVERAAAGAQIEHVVAAIGDAMEAASRAIADRVSAELVP